MGGEVHVIWEHPDPDDVFRWVLYHRMGGAWNYRILNRGEDQATIPLPEALAAGNVRTPQDPAVGPDTPPTTLPSPWRRWIGQGI